MIEYGNSATINGDLEVQSFDMMNCAKGFHILISRIYTRKIDAVIREVLCNAYDSHIAAKCESTPVKVTLPTLDDPHFRVQDFGVSLREDQMKMYITLFDSSKEDSAAETGYYGLGCKSPFAYANAFNIEVVKDGKRRMYSAFMDGKTAPKLAKLFEEETSDPQGVTVIVPVKVEDFRKFEQSYAKIAQWFPTTPECPTEEISYVLNGTNYQVSDCTVMDDPTIGRLYYRTNYGDVGPSDLKIVMGNVAYYVEVDQITNTMSDMPYQQRRILQSVTGFIRVPNGAIDIPPSRENVEYTPRTIKFLSDILMKAYANIVQEYVDQFDVKKTENFFEAVKVMDRAGQVGLKLKSDDLDHFFAGLDDLMKDADLVIRQGNQLSGTCSRYNNNVKGKIQNNVWNLKHAYDYAKERRDSKLDYHYSGQTFTAEEFPVYFVIGDHNQTTAYFKENQDEYAKKAYGYPILLEIRKGGKLRRGKPITNDIVELKQLLEKFFSGIDVKLSSELISSVDPEEKELVRKRAEFLKIYDHNADSWHTGNGDSVGGSSSWKPYDPALHAGKTVLAISRRNVDVYFPDGKAIDNLNTYIKNLKALGVLDKDAVVVTCMASAFDRIQKLLPGAKTLSDIEFTLDDVKDKLQVLYESTVHDVLNLHDVATHSVYEVASSDYVKTNLKNVPKDEVENHVLFKYIRDMANSSSYGYGAKRYCTAEYVLEKHGILEEAKAYMIEEAKRLYTGIEKYKPILRIMGRDSNADYYFEEYKELIKMIDKEEE